MLVRPVYSSCREGTVSLIEMDLSANAVPRTTCERMATRVRVLESIDVWRRQTGDASFGSGIERLILVVTLAETEAATTREEINNTA